MNNLKALKTSKLPSRTITAEGSELILRNKSNDFVIIPKKYRTEVLGMIKDKCYGCIDAIVETLPVMAEYAEDGTLLPEGDPILEKRRQNYINYMKNPAYKHRLSMELYGVDPWDSGNMDLKKQMNYYKKDETGKIKIQDIRENINKESDRRLDVVSTVPINKIQDDLESSYYPETNIIEATDKSVNHELQHSQDWYIRNKAQGFNYMHDIITKRNYKQNPNFQPKYYSEKNSATQNNQLQLYYSNPSEIKARINTLRLRAIDEFKYDQNNPFDINQYPELKNDRQYQELRDNLNFQDEDINELSKYIASGNIKPNSNIV